MANVSDFMNELSGMMQPQAQAQAQQQQTLAATEPPKTKLLLVSTHPNQINGYSKVMHNLVLQLAKESWIQLSVFGTQKIAKGDIGRKLPPQVNVIDASALEKDPAKATGFAFQELPTVIQTEKPDVVLLYNDLGVICTYLESIRKSIDAAQRTYKIWAYVDVTYPATPPQMIDLVNRDVERIFCFTKTWKDSLRAQGITRPMDIMPHGVDTKMFRSIPRDMARQLLGLPKDVFLFTSINKNIPRKRLDLLVMAFTRLIIKFPMKPIFLLIVADNGDRGGFSLLDIFGRELKLLGGSVEMFGNRMLITSKDNAYKDEDINMLYNAADAGMSCAEGEGFGLCSIEQMATGVPQIVPEINGYTEYCTADNSLMVKPKYRCYIPQAYHGVTGEAQVVDPDEVAKAMERYVFDEDLRRRHSKAAKETAEGYTWEKAVAILVRRLRTVKEED